MTRTTGRFLLVLLGLYTLFRLITTGILLWVTDAHQDPMIFSGEVPRYFDLATLWDGAWYERIATDGYPPELPVGSDGQVRQNEWAFYPIFPMLARALMAVTGLPFAIAGPVVATMIGYAAAVVMGLMLRERVGAAAALGGVCLFAAFPASPTLQVAYTESLATLLLCSVLWLLIRRQWWVAGAVALLTGLARPIALPLGLVALVAVVLRWRQRREEPVGRGEYAGMLAALVGCGLSGLIWPALVWRGTGVPTGYTETMSAWRNGEAVTPFAPTLEMVKWQFGDPRGIWFLVGFFVLLAVMMLGPWARGLGPVLQTWSLAYPFYLAAALDPWTSIYRYLILLFPVFVVMIGGGWPLSDRRSGPTWLLVVRTVVIAALFVGWQLWWSWELFRFEPPSDNPP
ncbi:hypothetical protein FNH13_05605 [Ornithinimicrobium ciconiae]|uniref:Glycosyltransferase RgtA/B/C/D-like domain-containing protein n=1 Tax=Ornithinimicrobium ciconiae TaxID=2594265 RepID=A0A516G8M8_9MICO|nr:hypothetical protein [Ornithinimicrobium ciconiae]QDO87889.1 hypothetical protein FNH13_05605 [Ornithinimicrobium ciconiae]